MNKKVSIITLGCKVNQYESNQIAKKLEDNGFDVIFEIAPADAYVLNTCAVTNEAERKSRGQVAKIKKVSENAPIFICGCSSQNDHKKFEKFEHIQAIIGTSSKTLIADKIIEYFKNNKNYKKFINTNISSSYQDEYFSKGERTRSVIKIQEGCNNYCSYCLIPYVRGRERSRQLDSIKNEVEELSKISNEIIFTGINLSNWGKDLNQNLGLKDIALLMQHYKNIRFRFSSLEQDIISKEFLDILKQTPNFAPHFHLSLQSGCDRTLKFMNRKYTSDEFYNKVKLIREYFVDPAITTDIIVGFPTETEEDFEESYIFAKKCEFAKMHIFPYSVRSGTVAANIKNIATNVKERVQKLSMLDKDMQTKYLKNAINKKFTVIIERKQNNLYEGHTENYIKCYIETNQNLTPNQIISVEIEDLYNDGVKAKILSY